MVAALRMGYSVSYSKKLFHVHQLEDVLDTLGLKEILKSLKECWRDERVIPDVHFEQLVNFPLSSAIFPAEDSQVTEVTNSILDKAQ